MAALQQPAFLAIKLWSELRVLLLFIPSIPLIGPVISDTIYAVWFLEPFLKYVFFRVNLFSFVKLYSVTGKIKSKISKST